MCLLFVKEFLPAGRQINTKNTKIYKKFIKRVHSETLSFLSAGIFFTFFFSSHVFSEERAEERKNRSENQINLLEKISNDSLGFFQPSPTLDKSRVRLVSYTAVGLYPVSMYWLYTQWYKNYPQSSFHFFNDEGEWLQMDKGGHMLDSYTIGKVGFRAMLWAGMERKKSIWYGAGIGLAFQTTLEVFDGFSSQWGFSVTDMAANAIGSSVFISQQLAWNEQRFQLKYSFHQSEYAKYRPNELGSNLPENILKDYNGLTYWLTVNPHSFMKQESKFPRWLSFAFGYGAEGLLGGYSNPVVVNGKVIPVFDRYRQYYLSLDFDLSRIKTRSRFLSGMFKVINFIRLPAPAIEFNNGHKTKFYAFYF